MQYDMETGAHSVYALHYHLVLVVKYRRKVLTDERTAFMGEVAESVSDSYDVDIKQLEHDEDHVHVLFKAAPTTNLTTYINVLKSATSRELRREYGEEMKDKLWGEQFWTDAYCLISTGEVSLDTLKEYVERQGIA